jgi:small-conductance mechanosensitive channel
MKNMPDSLVNEATEDLSPESILEYISGVKIFYTLLILLLTYFVLQVLTKILTIWGELSTKRRVTIKGLIPLLRILVWIGAIVFIIVSVLRPPMASLLAFGASIGVAVGFASQDLLKNIFGGITIIFDRPFKVGDKVSIGEFYGEITEIGLRSTRLVTPDDNLISVPNAELMNTSVSNANAGEDNCQVVTDMYLPLHADTDKARALAYQAAAVSPHIFVNKPIVVLFQQETIGHRVVLRMRVKAYVNDTRKEFAFKSHITEILTKELYIKDGINPMLIER